MYFVCTFTFISEVNRICCKGQSKLESDVILKPNEPIHAQRVILVREILPHVVKI